MLKTTNKQPGIIDGIVNFPETGKIITDLAETLLKPKEGSKFTQLQREIVACFVSMMNNCEFCSNSHGAIVIGITGNDIIFKSLLALRGQILGMTDSFQEILEGKIDFIDAFGPLWDITSHVYNGSSKELLEESFEKARQDGYTEEDIHDAIMIVAAFNMFNTYVKGMGDYGLGKEIGDIEPYLEMGKMIAKNGYKPVRVEI